MTEMFKDAVLGSIGQAFNWAVGSVFNLIGWPGIIAGIAALLLLLSLSARVMKFIHSPKGLGITTAVMVVGLMFAWWNWPASAATPSRALASHEPDDRRRDKPSPPPEPVEEPPVLAQKVVMPPAITGSGTRQVPFMFPPLLFDLPAVAMPTLRLATPFIPHINPPHAASVHPGSKPHHAEHKPHPAAATAARPATPAKKVWLTPFGRDIAAVDNKHRAAASGKHYSPQFMAQNAMMHQQLNNMMNGMFHQQFGGLHPMGGMHPLGGVHHAGAVHHGGHR